MEDDPIERVIKLLNDTDEVWRLSIIAITHSSGLSIWTDTKTPHIYKPAEKYPSMLQYCRFKRAVARCRDINADQKILKVLKGVENDNAQV